MTNPFSNPIPARSPMMTISLTALFLGVLIGIAWITNRDRSSRIGNLAPDQRLRLSDGEINIQSDMQSLQATINELRGKITNYEQVLARNSGEAKALMDSMQELKVTAGLTEVTGPGITVTLVDSNTTNRIDAPMLQDSIVHDYDVLRIVNELWNAGAEAIAVNGQRIVVGTSIRCVGSVIRVNDVPQAPPYLVNAIGDPKTLSGALVLPGGVMQEIRETDPKMISITLNEKMKLPAFNGSTTKRYAKPPPLSKSPGDSTP